MEKKILIESEDLQTRLALLEDGELVEYYLERSGQEKLAGNIYAGRVENVLPGMQAAFVDIGQEKNAFLHLGDIQLHSSEFGEELEQQLTPKKQLRRGQELIVQVIKEPGGSKGPRISSHITLPGRYVVLLPTVKYVGISRRIESEEERRRLRAIALSCQPDDMGLIVRTASEGVAQEALQQDIEILVEQWQKIRTRAAHSIVPALIHRDDNLVYRSVRDMLTPEVNEIIVDNKRQFLEAQEAVRSLLPEKEGIIRLYEGKTPLFSTYNLDSRIEKICARRVWLKSGGYLVIDHTEAFTVIDVNTGKFVGSRCLRETVLKTNREAAQEIVRQLRLRDVGGIIVIDFIDMNTSADQQELLSLLREELKKDRTKTNLVGITGLGLVEMTRKKLRQPFYTLTRRICPCCQGVGTSPSEETIARDILHQLRVKAAHLEADSWLITASQAVAGQLMLFAAPWNMNVYVWAQGSRSDDHYQIEPINMDQLPSKARKMTVAERK